MFRNIILLFPIYKDVYKVYFYFQDIYIQKNQSLLVTTNRKFFIDFDEINKRNIILNGIKYHSESSPFFFGCSCQHIFQKNDG